MSLELSSNSRSNSSTPQNSVLVNVPMKQDAIEVITPQVSPLARDLTWERESKERTSRSPSIVGIWTLENNLPELELNQPHTIIPIKLPEALIRYPESVSSELSVDNSHQIDNPSNDLSESCSKAIRKRKLAKHTCLTLTTLSIGSTITFAFKSSLIFGGFPFWGLVTIGTGLSCLSGKYWHSQQKSITHLAQKAIKDTDLPALKTLVASGFKFPTQQFLENQCLKEVVALLHAGALINCANEHGSKLLNIALLNESFQPLSLSETLNLLLSANAQFEFPLPTSVQNVLRAFLEDLIENDELQLFIKIIKSGINDLPTKVEGNYLQHTAIQTNKLNFLKILITEDWNLNVLNSKKESLLHSLVKLFDQNQASISNIEQEMIPYLKLLITKGINCTLQNDQGYTALDLFDSFFTHLSEIEKNSKTAHETRLLLSAGGTIPRRIIKTSDGIEGKEQAIATPQIKRRSPLLKYNLLT